MSDPIRVLVAEEQAIVREKFFPGLLISGRDRVEKFLGMTHQFVFQFSDLGVAGRTRSRQECDDC